MTTIDPHLLPTDRHGLIGRAVAHRHGLTDNDLAGACREGALVRVTRGVFALARDRTPEEVHRLTAIATLTSLGRGRILSHESAACIHGTMMLKPDLGRVHYLTNTTTGARRNATRHAHSGTVTASEVTVVDGITVTTLERTAVDVACTTEHGFAGALAVFDSALHQGADQATIASLLSTPHRHGATHARRAVRYASDKPESPGESWSRAQMIESGLSLPRLQHNFYDGTGRFVARTDFDWDGLLVGEFDGAVKYQGVLRPGETATDVVRREKRREDELRGMGIMVRRWDWQDLERRRVADILRPWLDRLPPTATAS